MTLEESIKLGRHHMEESVDHLKKELAKVRAGRATPSMVNGLMVEHYGTSMPMNQVANISTPDAKTLSIQPWDKSALGAIEKAIFEANLGVTPQNDGEFVRISVPPLTEERRRDLVKQTKSLGEEAKVSLRNARHKMMDFIKKEVKDGYPEDAGKRKEKEVDDMTHQYGDQIDALLDAKEKDIMTV